MRTIIFRFAVSACLHAIILLGADKNGKSIYPEQHFDIYHVLRCSSASPCSLSALSVPPPSGIFSCWHLAAPPPAAGGLDFSSLLGVGGGAAAASNPWAVPPQSASSSSSTPASNAPAASTPSGTGTGTATPSPAPAPAAVGNPEETYASQLTQMNDMGFTDREACVRALVASQGNVNIAVERILGGGV